MSDVSLPVIATSAAIGAATGIVSTAALWAYSVFVPRCQFWAPVVRSLPQREAVALTFDDGPHPEFTPRILDHLAAHKVRATFFVIGRLAREHPAILRRIHGEGHILGNHSYDHDHFGVNRNRAYWDTQLRDTQQAIGDVVGHVPLLFRPPMGFKTHAIAAAAGALRLPIIGWSVRGLDTRTVAAEQLAQRVLARTAGHDIVLLHDGVEPHRPAGCSQQPTVDALPAILEGLSQKGLRVVSLIEALVVASDELRAAAERTRARAVRRGTFVDSGFHIPHAGDMRWLTDDALASDGVNVTIPADQPFLRDGKLIPAALIEYLAQAAAARLSGDTQGHRLRQGVLVAITDFAIFSPVPVHTNLTLFVTTEKSFGLFTSACLEARSPNNLVANAHMTFHLTYE